jgi:hypothetical protein
VNTGSNTLRVESDTIKIVSALTKKSERDVLFIFNNVAVKLYEKLKKNKDQKTASNIITIMGTRFSVKAHKSIDYAPHTTNNTLDVFCIVNSCDNMRKYYNVDELLNELVESTLLKD